jgi:2,3-bisphosphoglycerate-dependent phosphoglycerate mutase
MVPYFEGELTADLNAGKTVLVTAHGNSIRAMVKHIDQISDADIAGVNIPTGIPLLYEFNDQFEPVKKGGEYLDPVAAKSAIEAVANQGKK